MVWGCRRPIGRPRPLHHPQPQRLRPQGEAFCVCACVRLCVCVWGGSANRINRTKITGQVLNKNPADHYTTHHHTTHHQLQCPTQSPLLILLPGGWPPPSFPPCSSGRRLRPCGDCARPASPRCALGSRPAEHKRACTRFHGHRVAFRWRTWAGWGSRR